MRLLRFASALASATAAGHALAHGNHGFGGHTHGAVESFFLQLTVPDLITAAVIVVACLLAVVLGGHR
jgi:hypothetical protein